MPKQAKKFIVERVAINRQGYDRRGRYWGVGTPLYRVERVGEDGEYLREHAFVRASSAKVARAVAAENWSAIREGWFR